LKIIATLLTVALALGGCTATGINGIQRGGILNPDSKNPDDPLGDISRPVETSRPYLSTLKNMRPPSEKSTVGVYSFTDKTGQRKSGDTAGAATLSTAVTQGAEVWLIQALKSAGNGEWFRVVERVGLDSLTKERQIIRQTRTEYDKEEAKPLPPMMFAGGIIEGGVISYEANLRSGGLGARYFGIGADKSYREDQVTVALRMVNVQTGEIILAVSTSKSIISYKNDVGIVTYIDIQNKFLEGESGNAENEPVNYAVRTAIEAAVIALIKQGIEQKVWVYADQVKTSAKPATTIKPAVQ
jgi:curli production assembly/transport component CsgG